MKAKGKFISTLLVIDTFLVSYTAGFNSRHVLIVDPSLPPLPPATKGNTQVAPATLVDKQKVAPSRGAQKGAGQANTGKSANKLKAPADKPSKSQKKKHKKTKVTTDK